MMLGILVARAQFEKKLNTHAFFSVPMIKSTNAVPSESVLEGYGKVPYIGFGVNYAFNTKASIQGDVRFLRASKLSGVYTLSHIAFDWSFKYNIIHSDKPVSPYVMLGFNTGIVHLSQKENSETKEEFEQGEDSEVSVVQVEKRNPEIKFTMINAGITAQAGVDFTFQDNFGANIGLVYQTNNIHNHVLLKEFFPENDSKFNFLMIQAGVKFSFLQKNKL